jgi:hypothetical protein
MRVAQRAWVEVQRQRRTPKGMEEPAILRGMHGVAHSVSVAHIRPLMLSWIQSQRRRCCTSLPLVAWLLRVVSGGSKHALPPISPHSHYSYFLASPRDAFPVRL